VFTASCPACGAQVTLRASQSTTAVCAFCRSTLVRDADALKRIGVQGELLEDYARVQVGTGGRYDGKGFSVVGRIQLRYEEGAWNEWYLLFDDGGTGWLSEAGGQYAVTFDRGPAPGVPGFDALSPGRVANVGGEAFTVTDRRTAGCTAAQGELPFPVDARWEARVADLRAGDRLLTLDWSDGDPPRLYAGRAVSLESLQPTLLRSADDAKAAAAALPGTLRTLECPSCGAPVRFVTKLATNVVCRQCASELSAEAEGLVVEVERADRVERATWLSLGDEGEIDGERWTVMGVIARRAVDDDEEWLEYLLYAPKSGFRWIVQVGTAFQWVDVLNEVPEPAGSGVRLGDARFSRNDAYDAVNTWVAGSFSWRPKAGDRTGVVEYERGIGSARTVLSMERTETEVNWSRAVDLPAVRLATAFGKSGPVLPPGRAKDRTGRVPGGRGAGGEDGPAGIGGAVAGAAGAALAGAAARALADRRQAGLRGIAVMFSVALAIFALPAALLGNFDDLVAPLVIAYVALWLPLRFIGRDD
jgi:hypothetical protein